MYYSFSIHRFIESHSGGFPFWVTINKVAIDSRLKIFI